MKSVRLWELCLCGGWGVRLYAHIHVCLHLHLHLHLRPNLPKQMRLDIASIAAKDDSRIHHIRHDLV